MVECISHSAFPLVLSNAINSNSIVEDFQDTIAPPRVKMYLLVDFDFSESAIQFASLYPSSIDEYFLYLKAYSLVFFK